MTIRIKLLLTFLITLLVLCGIGLYTVSAYHQILEAEREITDNTNRNVEIAQQSESQFITQLNAWKNVLLRGSAQNNYHHYLQLFYSQERKARKSIKELNARLSDTTDLKKLTQNLINEHKFMGRKLREALRLFNNTDVEPVRVTDEFIADFEEKPTVLLKQIIQELHVYRDEQSLELKRQHEQQERLLVGLLGLVIVVSVFIFLWLIDRNIAKPAEHAAYLADVIDNAQRVAKFGTWDWDSAKDKHYWSEGLYEILNIKKSETPSQQHFLLTLHEDDRERVRQIIAKALQEHKSFELEARIRTAGNNERVVQQRGQVTEVLKNGHVRMTSIIYDITERKEAEKRLAYLANYDTITDLPNRNLLQDRLQHAITQADRSNNQVALLYLDLDHFKAVNDALGHHAGDKLLIEVTDRLKRHIREGDTAARLGGDEFAIVLENFDHTSQVATVAEHVLGALNKSYLIDGHEVFVSASMGITFYPSDGVDVDTLLKNADAAMYLAKDEGRNTYHFFTEELNKRAHERLILENSLRLALERDEFQLYFQPQIELSTGRVIGAEALLRWIPDQNPISPARFIPVLEETGLIIPVGEWVLNQACEITRQWQDQGYKDFRIAVNLAARQLRQADIKKIMSNALETSQLDPQHLEVELTESTLIDTSISGKNLHRLTDLGVQIAIDDFGTGYSSLSYLKQYSVDVLKIDRSFIKDINIDKDDDAVTSAIIALSHKLDMKVIAEGVETLEQLEFLKKAGCDQAQGFLIGRPMPKNQFENWLASFLDTNSNNAYWVNPDESETVSG